MIRVLRRSECVELKFTIYIKNFIKSFFPLILILTTLLYFIKSISTLNLIVIIRKLKIKKTNTSTNFDVKMADGHSSHVKFNEVKNRYHKLKIFYFPRKGVHKLK